MPGMNYPSAAAYGLISNSFYLYIMITAILGLLIALFWSYSLPALGLKEKISSLLARTPIRSADNVDTDLIPRYRFLRITFGLMWLFDGFFQMRPDMPGGFTQQVVGPALAGAPSWLITLSTPFLNLWNNQPVRVDTAIAWLQIFIGLGLLFSKSTMLRTFVLYLSIAWSIVVFSIGNSFGIFYSGASWLTGAPSAILVYAFASMFLLAAQEERQWVQRNRPIALFVAAFLTVGGFLQALPGKGFWSHSGNSNMIAAMAQAKQPHFIISSLNAASQLAASQPTLFNFLMVVLPLSAAVIVLTLNRNRFAIFYAITAEFLAWWIGMDFGIFSSTSTDFNSGLPIIVLLIALTRSTNKVQLSDEAGTGQVIQLPPENRYAIHAKTLLRFTFSSTAIACVIALISMMGPASPAMAMVDSGGIQPVQSKSIPTFILQNYKGSKVTAQSLKGHRVILTFINPSCGQKCATTIDEIANAYNHLGNSRSQITTVILSPYSFERLMGTLHNAPVVRRISTTAHWHFLTGKTSTIEKLQLKFLNSISRESRQSATGTHHIYFISKNGKLAKVLADTGNEALSSSYSRLIASTIRDTR